MTIRFFTVQSIARHTRLAAIATLTIVSGLTVQSAGATATKTKVPEVIPIPADEIAPRALGEPIMAIASIKTQQITFYDADGWILRAPVSTGVKGRETPAGIFTVLQKNADHRSNLYDDAKMPHMQRLTWNGIAMHGGPLPGYAASHGCIRLPFGFAEQLFGRTRIGMRVIISPDDTAPVEISHPALLTPNAETVAAAPTRAETLEREAADAVKLAAETKKASAAAARVAASLAASLRKLERLKTAAETALASAEKALDKAKTDQDKTRAEERKLKASTKAAEAKTKFETAKADADAKIDAAAKAKVAAKEAADKSVSTANVANDAKLSVEPVSVYISRSTQTLYVRRSTQKPWADGGVVYDSAIEVPVTIRNPDQPIGTHIYTAMANNGGGLRWSAVTIDSKDSANNALDRIAIPQEVLNRIAPTALPRSSIIISDEPLSKETNYRTEFVAVLSDQPQGGFKTRLPTPYVSTPVASNNTWDNNNFFGFGYFDEPSAPKKTVKTRQGSTKKQVQQDWFW